MFRDLAAQVSAADWLALLVFLAGWAGYGWYADHGTRSLRVASNTRRLQWARRMVHRENRMTDVALTGNLVQSVSFYATTTTYIIAGVIAIAGTLDRLTSLTAELPFAKEAARGLTELKVLLLAGIFIFAYFKFTWALRQFNYMSIMVGGAPEPSEPEETLEPYAQKFAHLSALAGDEFNRGLRAYYFGFAAMTWFVSPQHFLVFTAVIMLVLWRRDYRSHTLSVLVE